MTLPTDKQTRKEQPMARGLLDYFPDALAAVAHTSYVGNQQHNFGEEMHWAREKSLDHADCVLRHLVDRGKFDTDGVRHSAKVAWRALAILQLELEETATADKTATEVLQKSRRGAYANRPAYASHYGRFLTADEQDDMIDSLIEEGVPHDPAMLLVNGISVPDPNHRRHARTLIDDAIGDQTTTPCFYIAGPMRGYKHNNFPAFDTARDLLLSKKFVVISPADVDRAAGADESYNMDGKNPHEESRAFALRDFHALHIQRGERGDGIAMLPGWESSTGATAEFMLARWLGLAILDASTGKPLEQIDLAKMSTSIIQYLALQMKD